MAPDIVYVCTIQAAIMKKHLIPTFYGQVRQEINFRW